MPVSTAVLLSSARLLPVLLSRAPFLFSSATTSLATELLAFSVTALLSLSCGHSRISDTESLLVATQRETALAPFMASASLPAASPHYCDLSGSPGNSHSYFPLAPVHASGKLLLSILAAVSSNLFSIQHGSSL